MFTWIRKLGAGGGGELWLAKLNSTGARVVVKLLHENANTVMRRGFAREARILGRRIPGVMGVIMAQPEAPRPFYVMHYLPNGSLHEHAGRLSRAQLRVIAADVAATLGRLHQLAIAHGDIKPANLLLDANGRAVVADPIGSGWGCTVLFAEDRGGTPGYWAPEILRGMAISTATDAYSFGASMYHLATGIVPQDRIPVNINHPKLLAAPEIREVVWACCQSNPNLRPSMADISLLLNGDRWHAVLARRARARNWAFAGGALALLFLFGK